MDYANIKAIVYPHFFYRISWSVSVECCSKVCLKYNGIKTFNEQVETSLTSACNWWQTGEQT